MKGWVIEDDDRRHVKGIYQGFWQGEGVKVRVREEKNEQGKRAQGYTIPKNI